VCSVVWGIVIDQQSYIMPRRGAYGPRPAVIRRCRRCGARKPTEMFPLRPRTAGSPDPRYQECEACRDLVRRKSTNNRSAWLAVVEIVAQHFPPHPITAYELRRLCIRYGRGYGAANIMAAGEDVLWSWADGRWRRINTGRKSK
jgi:hypothetical protein